jgi:acyl carrier protein
MTIEQDLQRYIGTELTTDGSGGAVALDEPLLSTGRVDSLGLLQILAYIDQRYGVALLQTGGPQQFETVTALATAIRGARGDR